MSVFVSGSVPTRNPRKTFAEELALSQDDIRIGDSVITKRLQKRGIHVFATPISVKDGYKRTLGRITYAAAIDKNDAVAVAALAEERARR